MLPAVLALVLLAPQSTEPTLKRTLTLTNHTDEPMAAGVQVGIPLVRGKDAPAGSTLRVFYRGKPVAAWSDGIHGPWFRLQSDLGPGISDSDYEVRYGGDPAPRNGRDVFDVYEDFETTDLDPKRWTWDKEIEFVRDARGLVVTGLPASRRVAFTPKLDGLERGFVCDLVCKWTIPDSAAFSFGPRVEFELPKASPEDEKRVAQLIQDLGEDDIQVRERATRALIKLGSPALRQLRDATAGAELEVRNRIAGVVFAIHRDDPPTAVGIAIAAGEELRIETCLGKSVTKQSGSLLRDSGQARVRIGHDGRGEGMIRWIDRTPLTAKVKEKPTGIRLEFWSTVGGAIGELRITRVLVRRQVDEMPEATYGDEEKVK